MTVVDLVHDLAYRSRALAQAHPLTASARRFQNAVVEEQKATQPMPELGMWAGIAILNGYCVRRVEEAEAGIDSPSNTADIPAEELEPLVARAAEDLRAGRAGHFLLGPEERTIGALEHIVASEVERRLDHLRDEVDAEAWNELGEYLAWWVVVGYALAVAEAGGLDANP